MHIRRITASRFTRRSRTRHTPALTALSCALALLAGAAWSTSTAHATGGEIEYSWVKNCFGQLEEGIMAGAQSLDEASPRVGDVFYVETRLARVGGACGAHMAVHVEAVLPTGVSLAISPSTPVKCAYDDGAGLTDFTEGCPQRDTSGMFGPAFDHDVAGGPSTWEMPEGRMLVVQIPVRSSRKLVGSASRLPSCGQTYGSPPCSAAELGDHLQFAIKVVDGFGAPWLTPNVPLFVQDGPAGETPPAKGSTPPAGGQAKPPAPKPTVQAPGASGPGTQLIASAPRTIAVGGLRRGVPVAVRVSQARSRVTARLTLRGRTVAQAVIRTAQPGTRTLRLRSTASGRKTLRRLRGSASAVLRVTVTPPSGSAATAQRQVKLRP